VIEDPDECSELGAATRRGIPPGTAGACAHCRFLGIQTGSAYEWRCALLGDWICETHCAEIQAEAGSDTRLAIASQIGWKLAPELLRNGCRCCPYSQGTSTPLRPNSLKKP
jgi:hypothetical protein